MSILNKYKRYTHLLRTVTDKYYDFVLSQDNSETIDIDGNLTDKCLSVYIDANKDECLSNDEVVSINDYSWEDATNSGVKLENIGKTGIDNGLIVFDKNTITLDEFKDIYYNSVKEIESADTRLHMSFVTGNTQVYTYDASIEEDMCCGRYYKLDGGFLQGFYKLCDSDYQILPQYIENSWHVELVIRPRDYTISANTLNATHSNNSGIIFYMGTRAENKFALMYDSGLDEYETKVVSGECTYSAITEEESEKYYGKYIKEFHWNPLFYTYFYRNDFPNYEFSLDSNDTIDFFRGDIVSTVIDKGYEKSVSQNTVSVTTDNKFLTFDRTKYGFTTHNYDEDADVVFDVNVHTSDNLYPIMNRTKTGKTTHDIEYESSHTLKKYDIKKDIENNAIAIKVNDDGSIGYRYLVKDCDSDKGYSVLEEKSFPNIVKDNEWNVINVKFKILNGTLDKCGKPYGKRKMKIYIYVNGYLKLVSKELDELQFNQLAEDCDKQEGVPYNISVGGGTMGLCDTIAYPDYKCIFNKLLPLEENFAGTFIGDIRSFKFYTCPLEYNEIKNNYLFEMG